MSVIKFLDLGSQPIANGFLNKENFDKEFFFNLSVGLDDETGLVTQMEYVSPDIMFNDSYAYRGSLSKTMRDHFAEAKKRISAYLPENPKVLEIGSNDGVFVKNWNPATTFAVEPCENFAKETISLGYDTYSSFWSVELAENIKNTNGLMDLIFAANCMCHIPDLDGTFKAVESLLSDEGLFVFEDPSLIEMLSRNSYDQIYDEHAHIFSVTAVNKILNRNGLKVVNVEPISVHGGSNRIWAMKMSSQSKFLFDLEHFLTFESLVGVDDLNILSSFAERVEGSKIALINLLQKLQDDGNKVISYGATSKSTTIFNYCGIDSSLIEYITDTTPEKQGLYSPGTHIPILKAPSQIEQDVDVAFLGAWNFEKEIRNKENLFVERGGKFITHVPEVTLR